MDLIGKLPELLSLKPSRFVVVVLATTALLFLPQQALEALGLSNFVKTFRPWIGGTLLLSASAVVVATGAPMLEYLRSKFRISFRSIGWP